MPGEEIYTVDPKGIEIHRLAGKHRNMTDGEYNSLKMDIELNGQLVPVITYKGKLVDGRHRRKALIELGIDKMKCMALPGNISLKEVENKVLSSENRRSNTVAQRAIMAWRYIKDNPGTTQAEAGSKFAVGQAEVARAKKVEEALGSDILDKLYENGYIYIGSKKYTTLKKILSSISSQWREPKEGKPMSDLQREALSYISKLMVEHDTMGLQMVFNASKNALNDLLNKE